MCRGCFSSTRYSLILPSDSCRPNQVLHQNRNGISTISHAVTKNSTRLLVDMRARGTAIGCAAATPSTTTLWTPCANPLLRRLRRRNRCLCSSALLPQPAPLSQFQHTIEQENAGQGQ